MFASGDQALEHFQFIIFKHITSHAAQHVHEIGRQLQKKDQHLSIGHFFHRPTTNFTEANATSSRSHAVLSVNVKSKARTANISEDYSLATLSVIDLAGSERAAVTHNKGARLQEGANINRSLLALGNCINALCDPRARGHIPYRDSKLTRLLKHSLGGNCQTSMIVCVAPASSNYDETHNTLQYANRAKEIKTKLTRNVISVDRHVTQYLSIIMELRTELEERKKDLAARDDKVRSEERSVRTRAMAEVQAGLVTLKATREDLFRRTVQAAAARAELESLEKLRPIVMHWLATTRLEAPPSESDSTSESVREARRTVSKLVANLTSHGQNLHAESQAATNSRSMYSANLAALKRKLVHPEAASAFEREIKISDLALQVAEAKARENGRLEAAKYQATVLATISTIQILLVSEPEETQIQLQQANAQVYSSLANIASLPSVTIPLSPVKVRSLPRASALSREPAVYTSSARAAFASPRKAARLKSGLKSGLMSPRKKTASRAGLTASTKKSVLWKDGMLLTCHRQSRAKVRGL